MTKWMRVGISLLVWVGFAYYLIGVNFQAKLGLIDDHEIAWFLGNDGKIAAREIPGLIMQTEVGSFGRALRFRPSYYGLRIGETYLFRDQAIAWYAARFGMLVLTLILTYWLLSQFFPWYLAGGVVFWLMLPGYWADIWGRLGPAEIYAVPGLALFAVGFYKLMKREQASYLFQIILASGYLMCVGAKENMLFLLLPLMFLVVYKISRKKLALSEGILYGVLIGVSLLIAGEIVLATSKLGTDVYQNQISYPARIKYVLQIGIKIIERYYVVVLAAALGFYVIYQKIFKQRRPGDLTHLLLIVFLVIAEIGQVIYYNQAMPTGRRYDFPFMILWPAIALTIWHAIMIRFKNTKVISMMMAGVLFFWIIKTGYQPIRAAAAINVEKTVQFDRKLNGLKDKLASHPGWPLIIESRNPMEYEPIASLTRYIRAAGLLNKVELYYAPQTGDEDALSRELNNTLLGLSKGTLTSEVFAGITPFKSANEPNCVAASFKGSQSGRGVCYEQAEFD